MKKPTKVKIEEIEKVNVSPVDQEHPEEFEETISPNIRMKPQPFEDNPETKPKDKPGSK